ncbi:unnamed protein product [Lymnaea stagnalis]|uniref:Uncharacterized protein n=1 Tax=Lymnaea stagnalis TaxID=6523 RepID=A0AAV2I7F2_LYMST
MAQRARWTECGLLLVLAFAASTYAAPSLDIKGKSCVYKGLEYLNEDTWFPLENNNCLQCQCKNGDVKCQFIECDKFGKFVRFTLI